MHARNVSVNLFCMIAATFMLSAAAAVEYPLPFEDSTTHLWGYKNSGSTVIIPPKYSAAEVFSARGIAAVADSSGWMYIDSRGTVLIRPFLFDNGPDPFQEGLARFTKDGKFGFFDESAAVIIPPQFDFAAPFSGGLAAFCSGCKEKKEGEHTAREGGQWGFIDAKGAIVIPAKFEKAGSFENGKAKVLLNGGWRFIDNRGSDVQ